MVLGAVLIWAVLHQHPLSGREQLRQNQRVRGLYGIGQAPEASRPTDRSDQPRSRSKPLMVAIVLVLVGCAFGYYVATQPAAHSPSVEGKESRNTQPAGPADKSALPGQQ